MMEKLISLDTRLFLWINGQHSPFWDKVMWFISGKTEWLPLYVIILFYLIYHYRKQSIPIIIGIIVSIILADQLAVNAFKEVFERLRPSHNPVLAEQIHLVNNYQGGMYGFVSNHAANTFAFAAFLSFVIKNGYFTFTILFWAMLVSYSRIYLGVHYPGDIICGGLLGFLIGWLVYIVYERISVFTLREKA